MFLVECWGSVFVFWAVKTVQRQKSDFGGRAPEGGYYGRMAGERGLL